MTARRDVPVWGVGVVAVALALPLLVAVVQMRSPRWYPVLDLAMTELRVRDVGTRDTPLIGLPGRIGESLEEQGSHPGPLSFYALAPTYRLLGSSSWALQVGSALVHLVAIGVALALARRRGGVVLFSAVSLLLAILISGLGAGALTEPWNPYLPLLWWIVLLLAVWSVLDDDLIALPVAVIAGSFCAQTHVPYLSLAVGLGTGAAVWAVARAARAPAGSPVRRREASAVAVAVLLGLLLWLPPTLDQLTEEPGNYTKLVDHFTTPPAPETPIGLRTGAGEALQRLDPWHLGSHAVASPSLLTQGSAERFPSAWRGAALLVIWFGAAVVAARQRPRERRLLALHAVAGTAFLLGLASISRIFGLTWYYLMLWMWAVGGLMVLAIAWTGWRLASRHFGSARALSPVVGAVGLAGLAALVTMHTTAADAVDAEPSDAEVSWVLGELVPGTVAALDRGEGAATGRDGRYHVTWRDVFHPGSQAFGLVSELERAGFDAGLPPLFQVPATPQRVVDAAEATAVVIVANGFHVGELRAQADAVEVAYFDPRTPDQIVRFEQLRVEATAALREIGRDDVVANIDENLFNAAVDPSVPDEIRRALDQMLAIGSPTAVFVVPPPGAS